MRVQIDFGDLFSARRCRSKLPIMGWNEPRLDCARPRPTLTGAVVPDKGLPLSGSLVSAVHFEQSVYHGSTWCVSAGQRMFVVRGGVEPPTFRFSGQPR